jgi:hypothetical protein
MDGRGRPAGRGGGVEVKPFPAAHRFQVLYQWISDNVVGDCSVLVNSPRLGRMLYICLPPDRPLFRRLYGPVADANGPTPETVFVEATRGYAIGGIR